jgi:hypothetical protein
MRREYDRPVMQDQMTVRAADGRCLDVPVTGR